LRLCQLRDIFGNSQQYRLGKI